MKVILYVGRNSSYCGKCNRSCDPRAKSHDETLGYSPGPGCGATFTHIMSVYVYPEEEIKPVLTEMRPDLEYVPLMPTLFDAEN